MRLDDCKFEGQLDMREGGLKVASASLIRQRLTENQPVTQWAVLVLHDQHIGCL
jgi:hypothetical protein